MISRFQDYRLQYLINTNLRTIVAVVSCIFIFTQATVFSQNTVNLKESVQTEKSDALQLPGNTYIIVDDDKQFGEILKRLDTPDFQISRPNPEPNMPIVTEPSQSFINSILIKGSMSGSFLQTSLVVRINQVTDDAVWTKIGLNEILLQSVTESNKPLLASTRASDRSWHVKTMGKGVHEVSIQFAVEINFDRSSRRIAFSIPESPETTLSLDIPERVLFASTSTKEPLKLNYDTAKNLYQIQGQVSPRNKLDVKWFGQSILSNQPSRLIECRGMISMRMDLDSVSSRQQWLINSISGIPDNIEFNIPSEVNITDLQINGKSVSPTFEKNMNNTIKVSIRNITQNETLTNDPISLDIVTRQFYSDSTEDNMRKANWSSPEWINMNAVSGVIAVELPQQWVIASSSMPNLQSIDPRDLPDRLRKTTAMRAFEFHGPLRNQKIIIQKTQIPLLSKSKTVGLITHSGIEYLTQFEIEGDISPNNEYTFAIPKSAQILFVGPKEVVERYIQVQETNVSNQKEIQFFLNQNLKATDKFQLKIRYIDKLESDATGRLAIPRIQGTLNHEATALLIASNNNLSILPSEPQVFLQKPSIDDIESFKVLIGKSFDNAPALLRYMDLKKQALYFKTLSLTDQNLPFEINQNESDISYRTDLEVIPQNQSFLLKYKFRIDKFSNSLSPLEFQINPQITGSIESATMRIIQGNNKTSMEPVVKEGSVIVKTNFLRNAPFIVEFDVRMTHSSQEARDPGQLQFDLSKSSATNTLRLMDAECLSMIVLQKSTTIFLAEENHGIQDSGLGNRDVSISENDVLFILNDPTKPISVMKWNRKPIADKEKAHSAIKSMQIVNKTFDPRTWHVIYDLNPDTFDLIIPKTESQLLNRVDIDGKSIPFDQTNSEYIIKLLDSRQSSSVMTQWTNKAAKSARFIFPYPLSTNHGKYPYPVEIRIISSPDSILFFTPFQQLAINSISIGRDNSHSLFTNNHLNGFKIFSLSSLNEFKSFSYVLFPSQWVIFLIILLIISFILTAFLVKKRKTKLVLLTILLTFSMFTLIVNDWYLKETKLFGIMISSTIISATVLLTSLDLSPKQLFTPVQNTEHNNTTLLYQVGKPDKEPSTVLKSPKSHDSETKMNAPAMDDYSNNEESQKDWHLGFDLSD